MQTAQTFPLPCSFRVHRSSTLRRPCCAGPFHFEDCPGSFDARPALYNRRKMTGQRVRCHKHSYDIEDQGFRRFSVNGKRLPKHSKLHGKQHFSRGLKEHYSTSRRPRMLCFGSIAWRLLCRSCLAMTYFLLRGYSILPRTLPSELAGSRALVCPSSLYFVPGHFRSQTSSSLQCMTVCAPRFTLPIRT